MVAGRPVTPLETRFWRKVDVGGDECWPWLGAVNANGYGIFGVYRGPGLPHRQVYAHRLVVELTLKRPLTDGECACHHCDNPRCCNPEHLFVGSIADNNTDMRAKCRHEHGERHHGAKLTEADVAAIRDAAAAGMTQTKLARNFGVGQDVISRIVNRKAWVHV